MISVIIPTYNRAYVLERAVRSVLNQAEEALEVIIVDDASSDRTQEVLETIGDARIRYDRLSEHGGACMARNRGVHLAQGDYIAFQDSDDEWYPRKLATQRQQLEQSGADVVFCAFERYHAETGQLWTFPDKRTAAGRITYEQLLLGNLCSTQTILGRKACFEEIPFNPDFHRLQDWDMMLRMVQRYDVRYFDDVLVRLYEQPDSISTHPEWLLDALRRINDVNRATIRRNDLLAANILGGIEGASMSCSANPWKDYLKAISSSLSFKTNARFGLKAAHYAMQGILHPADYRSVRKADA